MSWESRLAQLACEIRFEALPPEALDAAGTLLLDTLGCALGAIDCEPARAARQACAQAWPGAGRATLIGSGERVSAEAATLINGCLIRYLDFNDIYDAGLEPIHPSENIATALACCEEADTDGKRLLEAIIVGYEGHIRFSHAYAFLKRGLHPVSIAGWVAPMIAGKAWGLAPQTIAHAIGLSGSRSLTLTAISRGAISMAKASGYALPSMDGVLCTRLAACGFTGPSGSVQWLFDKVQPPASDAGLDTDASQLAITRSSLKRYAVQYELQSVVQACIELARELGERRHEIAQIDVGTYDKVIQRGADASKYAPTTRETADHSLPVCAALALLDGELTGAQFDSSRWNDADVRALLPKVRAQVDADLNNRLPKGRGARVTVTLAGGGSASRLVDVPEGDWTRPMSAAQVHAKFLEQAEPVLGPARAMQVIDEVANLQRAASLRPLMSALGIPSRGDPA